MAFLAALTDSLLFTKPATTSQAKGLVRVADSVLKRTIQIKNLDLENIETMNAVELIYKSICPHATDRQNLQFLILIMNCRDLLHNLTEIHALRI